VTEKLNNTNGFVYQGKLWEKTQLPNNLPAKSIFSFNFYRSNDNEIMGSNKGKIGAIPIAESEIPSMIDSRIDVTLTISTSGKIGFSWEYNLSDYKRSYFFDNRASYAERLKVAVNNVMQATHAKKVIIVAHSMGGLVARAYIRWLGGEQKVFKLLTIATPNHGIVDDGRAALEKIVNSQDWQDGGEYLEMSTRTNFKGKSYTGWLNDGWEQYCTTSAVRYATIAGNNNPFDPWFAVGTNSDGTIDRDSVFLTGAEFNALSKTSHIGNFTVTSVDDEHNILTSTNTLEIIKRWIFEDRIHVGGQLSDLTIWPAPFTDRALLAYSLNGNAVNVTIDILSAVGLKVLPTISIPLYPGGRHSHTLDSLKYLVGMSGYYAVVKGYDMNEVMILDKTYKFARASKSSGWISQPTLWITDDSNDSSDNFKKFTVHSDIPVSNFRYKLNDEDWTSLRASPTIDLANLPQGMNTLYAQGDYLNTSTKIAPYSWIEYGLYITTTNIADGYIGTPYNQIFKAIGGIAPYTWNISNGSLPTGLSFNASAGSLTGAPASAGSSKFTVQATDANAVKTIKSLTLNVLTLPNVSTSTLADAYVGSAYSQTLAATGGKPPYSWNITGTLPAGLTLNAATGVISGKPSVAKTGSFTVLVTDSNNKTANKALTVNCYPALSMSIMRVADPYVGSAYIQCLSVEGGKAPYVRRITNGVFAGLTFDANTGYMSGTPTVAGTSNISFQVTDANGVTASQTFTTTVYTIPVISTIALANAYVGTAYSQTLSVSGGKWPYTWAITTLPDGLSLNSNTGVIAGKTKAVFKLNCTVQVNDANNKFAIKVFAIKSCNALVSYGWNSQCQGGQVKSKTFEFDKTYLRVYKSFDLAYSMSSTDSTSFILALPLAGVKVPPMLNSSKFS